MSAKRPTPIRIQKIAPRFNDPRLKNCDRRRSIGRPFADSLSKSTERDRAVILNVPAAWADRSGRTLKAGPTT